MSPPSARASREARPNSSIGRSTVMLSTGWPVASATHLRNHSRNSDTDNSVRGAPASRVAESAGAEVASAVVASRSVWSGVPSLSAINSSSYSSAYRARRESASGRDACVPAGRRRPAVEAHPCELLFRCIGESLLGVTTPQRSLEIGGLARAARDLAAGGARDGTRGHQQHVAHRDAVALGDRRAH